MNRPQLFTALALCVALAHADSDPLVVDTRQISLELANRIAIAAVKACRQRGYQVSAVVVDRTGNLQTAMRDVLASRFTLEIAQRKANAVILSGTNSGDFVASRGDIRAEMNAVTGILMLTGGLAIETSGALIGAIGVSGAPGGENDAQCAQAGLDAVADDLAFGD